MGIFKGKRKQPRPGAGSTLPGSRRTRNSKKPGVNAPSNKGYKKPKPSGGYRKKKVGPVASEVRCNGCRRWFPSDQAGCEECGWERPAQNRWLKTARLNAHLFAQATDAKLEQQRYRESLREEVREAKRLGVEPAPLRPSTA